MADKWNLAGVSVDTSNNMTVSGSVTATGFTGDVTGNVTGYIIVPTEDPGVAGAVWNNSGTLAISAG